MCWILVNFYHIMLLISAQQDSYIDKKTFLLLLVFFFFNRYLKAISSNFTGVTMFAEVSVTFILTSKELLNSFQEGTWKRHFIHNMIWSWDTQSWKKTCTCTFFISFYEGKKKKNLFVIKKKNSPYICSWTISLYLQLVYI